MTSFQTSHEQYLLNRVARRIDALTTSLTPHETPGDLPSFTTATHQLAERTHLVTDLSAEVLSRSDTGDQRFDRVANAYASAVAPAGRAAAEYAHGYAEHRFFRAYTTARDTPDLHDARAYAFAAVQERMDEVQRELADARDTLSSAARVLDSPPPDVRTALSRSAHNALATDQPSKLADPAHQPDVPQLGTSRAR